MVSPPQDEPPRHVDGAFARLVADGARHHRRRRREHRRERDHKGGRPCLVHEFVLHELGEIHVFDDPGDLPDEPEKEKAEPDFAAERRRLGRRGRNGMFACHFPSLIRCRNERCRPTSSNIFRRFLRPEFADGIGECTENRKTQERHSAAPSSLYAHFTLAHARCQYRMRAHE